MNVILESQTGDSIVCIDDFGGSPQGAVPSWETSRSFSIGERVRYVGSYQDAHFKDQPNGWMVIFEASDGKRYAATQTYFATEEWWQRIEQHFLQAAHKG